MQSVDRRRFLAATAFGRSVLAQDQRQVQGSGATRSITTTLAADGRSNPFVGMVGQAGFTDRGLALTNPTPARRAPWASARPAPT